MSKTYTLKPWNEVNNHHFISKERWNALANKELKAEFFDGFLATTAMIYPKGEMPTLGNTFVVDKDDLRESVYKAPTDNTNVNVEKKVDSTEDKPKEKTYTKDDVRNAGVRVMKNIENEDEAIASALAIAKLIHELN